MNTLATYNDLLREEMRKAASKEPWSRPPLKVGDLIRTSACDWESGVRVQHWVVVGFHARTGKPHVARYGA